MTNLQPSNSDDVDVWEDAMNDLFRASQILLGMTMKILSMMTNGER